MFCKKCGTEINGDIKFCNKCGEKLVTEERNKSIIFSRKSQFYGVLIPIKIYLDGELVGSVKSGEELKISTMAGKHKISFNLWSGKGLYDIDISNDIDGVKVTFKLDMGLITSKPKIISITNL